MGNSYLIKAFMQQANATGSKSTILKPLGWMMAICISATLTSTYFKSETYIVNIFLGFSILTMILYFTTYIYCLINDRDALRSETYSIQKMALEKGFVGDNMSGIKDFSNTNSTMIENNNSSSNVEAENE